MKINIIDTQKSQQIAGIRKSFERNFGRLPDAQELQALGSLWKQYFANPQIKSIVDQIIAGQVPSGGTPVSKGQGDAYTQQLQHRIAELEGRLEQFSTSIEEREMQRLHSENLGYWKSWVAKKAESGVKITDEVDAKMAPFVTALRNANPEMDAHQVLDLAYRHATIDQQEQQVAGKVLTTVDQAKKRGAIKITPKAPAKADKDMDYDEIFLSGITH